MKLKKIQRELLAKLYSRKVCVQMTKSQIDAYAIVPFSVTTTTYNGTEAKLFIERVKNNRDGTFTVTIGIPDNSEALLSEWSEKLESQS